MEKMLVLLVVGLVCAVVCLPLDSLDSIKKDTQLPSPVQPLIKSAPAHRVRRRFINPPGFNAETSDAGDIVKMRTKRSEEECEKLQLCKLHAHSRNSFFAAFELYFVNKENARLWDHRDHNVADCNRRYSGCYDYYK